MRVFRRGGIDHNDVRIRLQMSNKMKSTGSAVKEIHTLP